jgi:hypothetical protein
MKIRVTIELLPETDDEKIHSSEEKIYRSLRGIPLAKGLDSFERMASIITAALHLVDKTE